MISLQVGVGGIDIYIIDNQHCCICISKLSVADKASLFFIRCLAFNTDSFEEPDFSGWTVTNNNDVTEELDVYDRETDCFAGAQSLHFYSGNNPVDFSMKQTVSGLEDGTYKLTAHIQGDAGDENPTVYFYALVDGEEVKADGKLQGYVNWYTVEIPGITPTDGAITVGAHVATAPGGWGTIDDITLVKE